MKRNTIMYNIFQSVLSHYSASGLEHNTATPCKAKAPPRRRRQSRTDKATRELRPGFMALLGDGGGGGGGGGGGREMAIW